MKNSLILGICIRGEGVIRERAGWKESPVPIYHRPAHSDRTGSPKSRDSTFTLFDIYLNTKKTHFLMWSLKSPLLPNWKALCLNNYIQGMEEFIILPLSYKLNAFLSGIFFLPLVLSRYTYMASNYVTEGLKVEPIAGGGGYIKNSLYVDNFEKRPSLI